MSNVNKWIIALSVLLPTLLEIIDTSVVNVSLDHIRGSLSAGLDEATWAITAYLVSNAIIIPLTGWMGRLFGRKRYLIASVVLFTVSSFLCGSSRTMSALIFFRVLQGIGGGALQPISQAILLESFPPAQYGIAMAMFGVGIMFGPIVGPVLGGWITDNWSWPWIFYINIPIGIISVMLLMKNIKDPDFLKRVDIRQKIDLWGISLIVLGVGALQIVLDKGQREDWFNSPFITRLAIISAVSLISFVIIELKRHDPILNLREFRDKSFSSANIIQFATFFVLFGSIVLLPLFVQTLMGYTAFLAGLVLAPGGVATLIVMPIVGKMVTKVNPKAILFTGLLTVAYSTYTMIHFNLYVEMSAIIWSRVLMGFGMGMVFVPLTALAFSTIKKEEMGNATSIFSILRNIAGSFGIAFMTTVLARRAQFHQARFSENLNPFNPAYQMGVHKAMNVIAVKTAHASVPGANAVIYKQLMQQSNLYAFLDAFYIATVILLCVMPLILLLKRPKQSDLSTSAMH
ncbi:MAG: DHA2 family efflux MFS transporter permease subunit [Candidatus Omnitrophica bacterium]|nr:DHA2 family efflux MFS transporter permease subunit [Candidatus Omnitrophota bacterium]